MSDQELKKELSHLGGATVYKDDYAPEVLEAFTNKHPENDYWVRFKLSGIYKSLPYYRTT